ncbi:zf-HC2 domain-containing protein [Streptomyces sp. HNM0574]|uniref:anti-sigma factor family protein n=1 Tax=Streptomyces sp. HNM0574 TaxID=2714954 RepID=UPI00146BDBF7|nr:zf-HC2 domain-containing protein [Streptomyces sp. HNM0574]NLU67302.1 zf-HC2 domain-containing protein [Streptomyces sp. HNM0574]
MSGTGGAGGGRSQRPAQRSDAPTPAEAHLGDRLAALVDGELGHDARERVLAHLATCHSCKAEADAQRSLKSVFADAAPPPPSDGLLARLQGLPAGGPEGPPGPGGPGLPHHGSANAPGGYGSSPLPHHERDVRRNGARRGGFAPAAAGSPFAGLPVTSPGWPAGGLPGGRDGGSALTPGRGFRVHEGTERSSSRGRRFAFAAAGAFSLAAIALGGALTSGGSVGGAVAGGDGGGASVGPARTAASGAGADRDGRRRGGERGDRTAPATTPAAGRTGASAAAKSTSGSLLRTTAAGPVQRLNAIPASSGVSRTFLPQGTVYPLLRDSVLAPPLVHSALTSASSVRAQGSGGSGAADGLSGRTPVTSALSQAGTPGTPAPR